MTQTLTIRTIAGASVLAAIDHALAFHEGDRPRDLASWRAELAGDAPTWTPPATAPDPDSVPTQVSPPTVIVVAPFIIQLPAVARTSTSPPVVMLPVADWVTFWPATRPMSPVVLLIKAVCEMLFVI